jgi:REP element-mobilizing transposase RayT
MHHFSCREYPIVALTFLLLRRRGTDRRGVPHVSLFLRDMGCQPPFPCSFVTDIPRLISLLSTCVRKSPPLLRGRDLHFLTFSCYQRQPLLSSPVRCDLLLKILERVRRRYRFVVLGYVVMPEHVHLLVSEPQRDTLSTVVQALKLGFVLSLDGSEGPMSRKTSETWGTPDSSDSPHRFWQVRFYDFNVWTEKRRIEKLRYIHIGIR